MIWNEAVTGVDLMLELRISHPSLVFEPDLSVKSGVRVWTSGEKRRIHTQIKNMGVNIGIVVWNSHQYVEYAEEIAPTKGKGCEICTFPV